MTANGWPTATRASIILKMSRRQLNSSRVVIPADCGHFDASMASLDSSIVCKMPSETPFTALIDSETNESVSVEDIETHIRKTAIIYSLKLNWIIEHSNFDVYSFCHVSFAMWCVRAAPSHHINKDVKNNLIIIEALRLNRVTIHLITYNRHQNYWTFCENHIHCVCGGFVDWHPSPFTDAHATRSHSARVHRIDGDDDDDNFVDEMHTNQH